MRAGAGGIGGLWRLLREHGRAVEADLRRFYNVRLRELFTGDLTLRELIVLIKHLPSDCALARSMHGPAAEWGQTEHLLGDVIDLLDIANHQRGGSKKRWKSKLKRPEVGRGAQP